MPYTIEWLVPHKVIFERDWGEYSAADLEVFDRELVAYLDSSTAPLVHVIADATDLHHVPLMAAFKDLQFLKHPRLGWYIGIGVANKFVKVITSLVGQVFKIRYRFVDTPAEALAFLQKVDSTLPDLPTAWTDYQAQQHP
jgi:hypothetical protein